VTRVSEPLLGRAYQRALEAADELFRDEMRKGKSQPYLAHLLAVSALVLRDGGSRAEVIAGLLHDVMEDKGRSKRDIEVIVGPELGPAVADIVFGCSDGVDEEGRRIGGERGSANWHERKRTYLAHLELADPSVLRVSAADKLDNAADLLADLSAHGDEALRVFNAPPADQLWWYESLDAIFTARLHDSFLPARLHRTVVEIIAVVDIIEATRLWEEAAAARTERG